VAQIEREAPATPHGTITGQVWNLDVRYPDAIAKPERGLFRSRTPVMHNVAHVPSLAPSDDDPTIVQLRAELATAIHERDGWQKAAEDWQKVAEDALARDVSLRVRRLRHSARISSTELSRKLGLARGTVSAAECERKLPPALERWCDEQEKGGV